MPCGLTHEVSLVKERTWFHEQDLHYLKKQHRWRSRWINTLINSFQHTIISKCLLAVFLHQYDLWFPNFQLLQVRQRPSRIDLLDPTHSHQWCFSLKSQVELISQFTQSQNQDKFQVIRCLVFESVWYLANKFMLSTIHIGVVSKFDGF